MKDALDWIQFTCLPKTRVRVEPKPVSKCSRQEHCNTTTNTEMPHAEILRMSECAVYECTFVYVGDICIEGDGFL